MRGLQSLIGESLAMDHRYVPVLMESIHAESRHASMDAIGPKPLVVSAFDHSGAAIDAEDGFSGRDPGSIIAVVPITGVMTRHGGWFAAGTSAIGRQLRQLDNDASVGAILLDVDSPGGSVYGTSELSNLVFSIRQAGRTKIVAVADPLMASAASWVSTAAEEVYAIGSADVGSIGVISAYTDYSEMLAQRGVVVSVERTPELKARFSGVEPMTEQMRETMRARNVEAYGQFIQAMARNRGVDVDSVEAKFGGGEVMGAASAVQAGLIDGIASIDEVIADLVQANQKSGAGMRAKAALAQIQLETI